MNQMEQKLTSLEVAEMENPKCIYVLKAQDGSVKVCVSRDISKRKNVVQGQSGRKIVDCFFTDMCSNSYQIELEVKKRFSSKKMEGEWFVADFEAVKNTVVSVFIEMHKEEIKKESDGIDRLLDFIFS